MIFEDIIVPIPAHKRISQKGKGHVKAYVYEVLKRKGPNVPKDIVKIVGVAVSETTMNPNENYFDLHPEYRGEKPLPEEETFSSQIHIGSSILCSNFQAKTNSVFL